MLTEASVSETWGDLFPDLCNPGYFIGEDAAEQCAIIKAEAEGNAQVKKSAQNPVGIGKRLAVNISPVPVR